jgi:hypothetical protein
MSARKPSGIAKWPEDERPRERLLSRGAHALTDAACFSFADNGLLDE